MDGLHSTHALFQYQGRLEGQQEKNYYWPTFCITMFLLLEFGQIMIHFWRTVNQFLGLLPWGSLANLKFKRKHSWQEIIFSKVNNNLLICFFFCTYQLFSWAYLKWDIVLKVSWIHECMHKNTCQIKSNNIQTGKYKDQVDFISGIQSCFNNQKSIYFTISSDCNRKNTWQFQHR